MIKCIIRILKGLQLLSDRSVKEPMGRVLVFDRIRSSEGYSTYTGWRVKYGMGLMVHWNPDRLGAPHDGPLGFIRIHCHASVTQCIDS